MKSIVSADAKTIVTVNSSVTWQSTSALARPDRLAPRNGCPPGVVIASEMNQEVDEIEAVATHRNVQKCRT